MLVTFIDFIQLGYKGIEGDSFDRLSFLAEQTVHKHTFNRINADNITEANKRGICELILVQHSEETEDVVTSFSNAKYSESYEKKAGTVDKTLNILDIYFTQEQLYRGN